MTPPEESPNSARAWDAIWSSEGGVSTWRTYPASFQRVLKTVGTKKRILDIGCGVGILASELQQAGNDVTGVDISPFAIQEMQSFFPEITGKVADILLPPLPFEDKDFDWVVATEFLEHFTEENLNTVILPEISRLASRAVFCVPNDSIPKSQCKEHETVLTPYSLEILLKRHFRFVNIGIFDDVFEIDNKTTPIIAINVIIARCSQTNDSPKTPVPIDRSPTKIEELEAFL